ncbi:SRPBCC domain-containing protein [Candidatus Woesearchaeota archaeon]|nr:SRPBCC domain-containing protein [Candidatus Woesearchaeota archaeon]
MLIKKEILINADIKKVWKAFCDLEKWPKWGGYIVSTRWLTNQRWKKGAKFAQTIKGFYFIKKLTSNTEIIKVRPHSLIKWAGTRKLIKGTHTFKFEKIDGKTKVSNIENFTGLLAPVLFPLIKSNFNFYFEQFLKGLKKESERQ